MIVGRCSEASLGYGPAEPRDELLSGGNGPLTLQAAGSHGRMSIAS